MDAKEDARSLPIPVDLRRTGWFFGFVLVVGVVLASLRAGTLQQAATPLLWILACLTAGTAIGFLFGIPKILQSDRVPPAENDPADEERDTYRQQVNTNLTEISDWLTKIIVGLGLINLKEIPPQLASMAGVLAAEISPRAPQTAVAFAHALIVCFSVLGFLFGYLTTRLFLAGAFSRADQQALRNLEKLIGSQQVQVDSIEKAQSFLSDVKYSEKEGTPQLSRQAGDEALHRLEQLAGDYLRISSPDWGERVRLKDKAANEMADLALSSGISKDEIRRLAEQTGNEGLVLALATVINLRPEPGDFERLMSVALQVARLHVRYRVLLAISKLFKARLISAGDRQRAVDLISIYRNGADASLQQMINSTLSLIETAA